MSSSRHGAVSGHRLPEGYVSIRDILDDKHQHGSFINVVGLVIDCQSPTPTRGSDWKCALHLRDKSVESEHDEVITCHIFMGKEEMPEPKCGDVLALSPVKVQFRDGISLLSNRQTKFGVFTASKIPKPPGDPSVALATMAPSRRKQFSKAELNFVSQLYHSFNKGCLPSEIEYDRRQIESRTVREKFSLLQDVRADHFYDIMVQLVRTPYDTSDKMTIWVSDYTENTAFYPQKVKTTGVSGLPDDDPHGYLTKYRKKSTEEQPDDFMPEGKRSLQLTIFEPHASVIRAAKLSVGSWVTLKNLQVKYGHNGNNLEGYLREDRAAFTHKIQVIPLDPNPDRETIEPRHYEALKRFRDYKRSKSAKLGEIEQAAIAGQKRKSNLVAEEKPSKTSSKDNSKNRRKAKRAREQKDREEQETSAKPVPERTGPTPNLNSAVKCENHTVPPSGLSTVLDLLTVETEIDDETVELPLPFVNLNHRVDVRVTDFRPSHLKDFAFPKKTSSLDVLSDNEGSDLESGSENGKMADVADRVWEWRFSLELQDATVDPADAEKFWVVVDNPAAQCLTNLDASDLEHDKENLEAFRQRMFILWGNLEELKNAGKLKPAKTKTKPPINGDQPPPDSSDNEAASEPENEPEPEIANRPFSCCVRQYGIKVRESNPAKADAGNGHRWMRVFGLYGTRIAGP